MSKRLDYTQIAPAGVKALGGVYGYVMQSDLSPVLVDLVYLRVSQINSCAYCLDMHTRDLLQKRHEGRKARTRAGMEGSGPSVRRASVQPSPGPNQ
jgi:AhpD family alkylhydroperoxidase